MSEYDSILKEKKKKIEPIIKKEPPKTKKFPTFPLMLLAVMLVFIISYIVYYNTILAKDKIIINNLNYLKNNYKNIIDNLNLNAFDNDNIEGTITLNETNQYSFLKDKNNYYLKTPSITKYINNNYNNNYNNIEIKNILSSVPKDKYTKVFYIDNKVPIVESTLILDRNELEQILKRTLINEYEVRITSLNHAISNEILNMKISITNKITSDRKVIIVENNNIYYTDANHDLRFNITIKNNDFNIKIYKNDLLYSVITGSEKINTYDYKYQIIDKLYTINLSTRIEEDKYIYDFTYNIEKEESSLEMVITTNSNELYEMVNYKDLTPDDNYIYNQEKNLLLEFINKYQNNI